LQYTARQQSAAGRKVNNSKGFKDLCLQTKARIWP